LKTVKLILGGARSGKSTFAQEYARKNANRVLFVATATAGDEDMRLRIEKHRSERPACWRTLEAYLHVGCRIEAEIGDAELVIIDCITLLINNLFACYDEAVFDNIQDSVLESRARSEIGELQTCLTKSTASFLIISNEVGLGIVPDNRMGRLYRDILGRVNQMLSQSSDEVYLLVAGIPLRVKPGL
jgi:adenosylcobinamide kinase / adenosylcobinamide-phosphate guanylyltransferase